jgi:microcystin synthetase protein McyB
VHSSSRVLDADCSDDLDWICAELKVSPYRVLLAAYNILLNVLTGLRDVPVTVLLANRNEREFLGTVGYFSNNMFFREEFDPNESFATYAKRLSVSFSEAIEHSQYPANIVKEVVERDYPDRSTCLFQVVFGMVAPSHQDDFGLGALFFNPFGAKKRYGNFSIESVPLQLPKCAVDLDLRFQKTKEGVYLCANVNADRFDLAATEKTMANYVAIVSAILLSPNTSINELLTSTLGVSEATPS